MEYLYLWLNLGSFIIPFLFSFHPRLQFYKRWKGFFIGILVMMAIFIPWDVLFTNNGFWGFNDDYITGYKLLNLPIEEWLFFFCIPYACIFTHYALLELNPKFQFSKKVVNIVYIVLVSVLIITLWYNYNKWYPLINFLYVLIPLGLAYNYFRPLLQSFFATYLIILIPFFIVNGILTGTGIEEPVVWYNNTENLGIRLLTIPIEDTIYNLGMLLTVLLCTEYFNKKTSARG
ncbi:MAG TPA: lycopene cyclase domain-containing protein [Flavobacteriaceae bacterium]|nr:lycopene cyclase [Flavobacteriaceae bacterium]MAY52868.1 lycopene cyclase [Flavobacteriaceae bacterium]HBR54671.1 lycopene cyclase domain-containing protein [Flavobacteriaceae bacterium]|tara:strand:- start:47 stop:742 length:696 start_codon:yes stop_codon:yes gene_type:complete